MWRFNKYAGVRGWQLQQPIKLSLPKIVADGAAVILDSDVVFLRPFNDNDFALTPGNKRIMLRMEQDMHRQQMEVAWGLLKQDYGNHGYGSLTRLSASTAGVTSWQCRR